MTWKCIIGKHRFVKYMGPENWGNGKFMQRMKCLDCHQIKKFIR